MIYSGDILTDVALEPLITEHFRAGNDVTLGLRRNTGLGVGVVVRDGRVVEISTKSNPKENLITLTFPSGIRKFSLAFLPRGKFHSFPS